jgi:adenylosuccinate synthase
MNIRNHLRDQGWFAEPGAYVLVDGQFGSTGKGLLAGYLATVGRADITHVTTNAGPNSGHTAYFFLVESSKIVTQQVPVASVFLEALGHKPWTLINAGAVIDDAILAAEVAQWLDYTRVLIHPNAAMISAEHRKADQDTVRNIASTGKGIGPAIADKVTRQRGVSLAGSVYMPYLPDGEARGWDAFWDWSKDVVFVETAQGFSLGLNSARFYPHVTSRECTVAQAIADARIPPQMVKKVVMTLRTFPIRVGNVGTEEAPISSGHVYPDQEEVTWKSLGVEPEITTVTKRIRRIFSWSRIQFREACAANRPDLLFLNFCNYMTNAQLIELLGWIEDDYRAVMGRELGGLILGYGPRMSDLKYYGADLNYVHEDKEDA